MNTYKIFQEKRKDIEYHARSCSSMGELRLEIDLLDRVIVELLSVRQGFMEQAADIKQDRDLVRDDSRIEDVVAKVMTHAEKVGAHPGFIENLYREMIEWSINYEMEVFDDIN